MTAMFGLCGQTALVTGARTGIGRAVALALADAGADLVLWGRNTDGLAELADEVQARGQRADLVGVDLGDLNQVERHADQLATSRRIDILVNNAGIIKRSAAVDVTMSEWRQVLDVNLDAAALLALRLGSAMVKRGQGRIINVASLLSFQGGIRVPAYTASKHAIAGLTKALANEWAHAGVTVNALAPGYIATDNTATLRADPEREPEIRGRIPADRWGTPDDLAGAAVFLASPAASYVNGHVLVVDGGWMAR